MLAVIHSRRTPQLPDSPPHNVVWGLPRVGASGGHLVSPQTSHNSSIQSGIGVDKS